MEESADLRRITRCGGISFIDLLAPTSDPGRVRRVAAAADGGGDGVADGPDGFLYLVSVTGVTGSGSAGRADLEPFVERVRAETPLPLYVGFGVSTPEQARETTRLADGVIIGSQLIRLASGGRAAAETGGAGDGSGGRISGSSGDAAGRIFEFLSGVKDAISTA